MLSPRSGLLIPDPELAYAQMTAHAQRCDACLRGVDCPVGMALRKTWAEADMDLAIIEAELDDQAQDLADDHG